VPREVLAGSIKEPEDGSNMSNHATGAPEQFYKII
jgi:hypothetical protein